MSFSKGYVALTLIMSQEWKVVDIKCRLPQVAAERNPVSRDYLQDQEGVYAVSHT